MTAETITEKDREMAEFCKGKCPVCVHGRKRQRGLAYWFMKNVEAKVCPYCQAYERVFGKPAHERLS